MVNIQLLKNGTLLMEWKASSPRRDCTKNHWRKLSVKYRTINLRRTQKVRKTNWEVEMSMDFLV